MRNQCKLSIHLDRGDRTYRAGDELSGYVEVEVNADCECKGLDLSLRWKTRTQTDSRSGPPISVVLFQGRWRANGVYRYPFTILLPNGPLTFQGEVLHVEWVAAVKADIPWSVDPKDEESFLLVASEEPLFLPYNSHLPGYSLEERESVESSPWPGVIGVILVFAFFALFMIHVFEDSVVGRIGCSFAMMLMLGIIFLPNIRISLAKRQLGRFQVTVEDRRLRSGDWVKLQIDIPAESEGKLNKISATLVCTERVLIRGKNPYEQSAVFHREEHHFPEAQDLIVAPGESLQLHHRFLIPRGAPPSFHIRDNNLDWRVEVIIDIDGLSSFEKDYLLEVSPSPRLHFDRSVSAVPNRDEDLVGTEKS